MFLSTALALPKPTYARVNSCSPYKVEMRVQNVAKNAWIFKVSSAGEKLTEKERTFMLRFPFE